jgi:hypothetical protein
MSQSCQESSVLRGSTDSEGTIPGGWGSGKLLLVLASIINLGFGSRGAYDHIFLSYYLVVVKLTDDRLILGSRSKVIVQQIAAGPRQHSHSRFWVSWDS